MRRLENKVLSELSSQTMLDVVSDASPLKVSLDQFYGIEINDFAVSVANTALWIAQLQANIETQTIITSDIIDLPLSGAATIHHANALEVDWSTVIEPSACDYIIGNPPFLGARNQSTTQKAELKEVFDGARNVGSVDYVSGWFIKAANYIGDFPIRCAFVATNSICQGEQVANIWCPIYQTGVRIGFAHNTFRWSNEAADAAHVFCVIVGFSKQGDPKRLYHYTTPDSQPELQHPEQLNEYLAGAPDVFVWNRRTSLCSVPAIGIGSQPIGGGNYLFTPKKRRSFLPTNRKQGPIFTGGTVRRNLLRVLSAGCCG
nr:DNA methyltransferase [Corynebacterium renale]